MQIRGTYTHTYKHTHIQTYTHTQTHTHMHTHSHRHAYTHTLTHTHIHVHAHTHFNMGIYWPVRGRAHSLFVDIWKRVRARTLSYTVLHYHSLGKLEKKLRYSRNIFHIYFFMQKQLLLPQDFYMKISLRNIDGNYWISWNE